MSELLRGIPDDWGRKFELTGGAISRTHTGPNEIKFTAQSHMALLLLSAQPDREVALNSDHKVVGVAPVGALEIIPATSELFARWVVEKENLLFAMNPDRLASLARLEFDTDAFDLQPPKLGHVDDKAILLGQLLREETLRADQANAEYLDSLLTLFGIHLLRQYSSIESTHSRPFRGGLKAIAWRKINEYIQEHLAEKISIDEMAQIAQLSPSHFIRAFRETTGQPPHQYLLTCRLNRARELLTTTDLPVGAVANATGFHDGSHMTAAMQKAWQTTASDLRKKK